IIVVSATPGEALRREWEEHQISQYAALIAGQEMGTKKQHLAWASNGRYEPGPVLMLGDAPGDLEAARANRALFYPINPDAADTSWERFADEGFDKFILGDYAGQYESAMISEFDAYLPEVPPWAGR